MQAIWKQVLDVTDSQIIELPLDSKVLCVQTQNNKPCIWFINYNTSNTVTVQRKFKIYGTGHTHDWIGGTYIGTFQLSEGTLVFHVFEETI